MIGSDLDGADLQSRVASWAASAASDDAAAVRAVIEVLWRPADGGPCGRHRQPIHRQRRRHAARARNVVRSQQLTVTYDATFENIRLGFTFRFDDIAVKGDLGAVRATSQGDDHDPRCRRHATSASPAAVRSGTHEATGRSRGTCTSSCRSSQEGAAPAPSESVTRIQAPSASACGRPARRGAGGHVDLPARTGAVQVDLGAVVDVEDVNAASFLLDPVDDSVGAAPGSVTACERAEQRFTDAVRIDR